MIYDYKELTAAVLDTIDELFLVMQEVPSESPVWHHLDRIRGELIWATDEDLTLEDQGSFIESFAKFGLIEGGNA